jgi:hypothetical protein
MHTGDALEWQSGSTIGRLIRAITNREVNHTAPIVRTDLLDQLGYGRRFVIEALEKGLMFRLVSQRLLDFKGRVWWLKLKDKFRTPENERSMLEFMALQLSIDKGYDYLGLIDQMDGFAAFGGRWHCSEFYQGALTHAGIIPRMSWAMRPGEFYDLGIYEKRELIYSSYEEL